MRPAVFQFRLRRQHQSRRGDTGHARDITRRITGRAANVRDLHTLAMRHHATYSRMGRGHGGPRDAAQKLVHGAGAGRQQRPKLRNHGTLCGAIVFAERPDE